ncbi:AmmeMemoRadiSam system protein A [Desulfonatronum thioautotrophicum]|uniref:AmmeMemoRadiSam system protein A n=1 Tax=Desulfonatronum thioautotrophicum TaxID=617001 RepID=UPI0005EB6DD5|nr:AmmeMemoRadiSam system protein A [Desulfonatronum thioautotrophicum]
MSDFQFQLTQAEQDYLRELALLSIAARFDPQTILPKPVSETLQQAFGAFVTLKKQGRLRGCIGNIVGDHPVRETIINMAQAAAFNDPRFPPVSKEELAELRVEISILSPLANCDPEEVVPGRHGLLVRSGPYSGLLLPQVAVEHGWDREAFLSQTCRKAGLAPDAWQQPDTQISCFEAVIF